MQPLKYAIGFPVLPSREPSLSSELAEFSRLFKPAKASTTTDCSRVLEDRSSSDIVLKSTSSESVDSSVSLEASLSATRSEISVNSDFVAQPAEMSSQWLIEQYELQHSMQNATKNYVCTPLQSMEALYVEQFKKMARRESVLKEVPVAETNRFDVSSQLKLNDEEANSLDELVKAFRNRRLQRVGVLRKNQTVCEESLRSQCRYLAKWFKSYVAARLQDTVAEVQFALKTLCLYTN